MAFDYVAFEELKSQIENTVKDWAGKYNFDSKKILNYFQSVTNTERTFSIDDIFPKSVAFNADPSRKIEIGMLLLTLYQLEKLEDLSTRELILNAICFFVRNSVSSACKSATFFIYTPKEQNSTLYSALNSSLRLDKENPDASDAQYKVMSKSLYYFWKEHTDIFGRAFGVESKRGATVAKGIMEKLRTFCVRYNPELLAPMTDLSIFSINLYKTSITEPINSITVSSC